MVCPVAKHCHYVSILMVKYSCVFIKTAIKYIFIDFWMFHVFCHNNMLMLHIGLLPTMRRELWWERVSNIALPLGRETDINETVWFFFHPLDASVMIGGCIIHAQHWSASAKIAVFPSHCVSKCSVIPSPWFSRSTNIKYHLLVAKLISGQPK